MAVILVSGFLVFFAPALGALVWMLNRLAGLAHPAIEARESARAKRPNSTR